MELKHSLIDLMRAKGENLVRFLSLILDKLIQLMVRPPVLGGQPGRFTDILRLTLSLLMTKFFSLTRSGFWLFLPM